MYIEYNNLSEEAKQFISEQAEYGKSDLEDAKSFAKIMCDTMPDAFFDILSNEVDFDDMPENIGKAIFMGWDFAVVRAEAEKSINCYFLDELNEYVDYVSDLEVEADDFEKEESESFIRQELKDFDGTL